MDDSLGSMTSLEILHLDSNQITAFPTNTDGWTNLKTLTASENSIRGITFLILFIFIYFVFICFYFKFLYFL